MNNRDVNRYKRLLEKLEVPADRKEPTQSNLRWLLANAWIKNQSRPALQDLMQLIKPYV